MSVEGDPFLVLSKTLTGEPKLNPDIAAQYLQRLTTQYPAQVHSILAVFGKIATNEHATFEVKRRIIGDPKLQLLAQQIIPIWYTSEFARPDGQAHTRHARTVLQRNSFGMLFWRTRRPTSDRCKQLN